MIGRDRVRQMRVRALYAIAASILYASEPARLVEQFPPQRRGVQTPGYEAWEGRASRRRAGCADPVLG